jgi:Ni,Fe-hydrogenase maturation factor
MSASSHTLPLTVLGTFLETELSCCVEYLGIQPQTVEFLQEMSKPVKDAVDGIIRELEIQFSELNKNG